MPKRAAAHTGSMNEMGSCNAYIVFEQKEAAKMAREVNMSVVSYFMNVLFVWLL